MKQRFSELAVPALVILGVIIWGWFVIRPWLIAR